MSKLRSGGCAALVALALGGGVAWADATIYAAPPNQFFQGDVTIAQGEAITFTNMDTVAHDVTASGKGADGKPLFASAQVGTGQSAPVAGVEYLTAGSYPYICSIHPFMKGTITVTSDGAPKPKPGGGGGGGGGSGQAAATDTTPASISVKMLDTKRSKVRKRHSLQVAVTTNEPAGVAVTARSGQTVIAQGTAKLTKAGTRKLSIKLTKAGLAAAKA
ncbi:MAG TPA: plastocyanin/azurin family copper-binding protein, partial [Thermoleophilaceae bacterium]|nr:plastocyanin/azurin family copper-binding protein [Thermoleophilaceae bacterium]